MEVLDQPERHHTDHRRKPDSDQIFLRSQVVHFLRQGIGPAQQLFHLQEKIGAFLRQNQPLVHSLKQLDMKLFLQFLDRIGDGWLGMVMSLQMVMFAYGGIEIIGITAGEAKDPEKSIPRAINSVPMRILVFYVGTLFVIMSIYPWNQVGTDGSPFVLTFQHLGITFAASILNFVVLTASLSAINSDVFGVGRMLHGMAEQGSAPKVFAKTSRRGIPWVTVMVMTIALLFAVYLNYIMPENVFLVIASLATFATVWVWIMILLSQIAFRRRLSPEEVKALKFKVPGGVVTTVIGLLFLAFIIALIGYHPDTRISLYVGMAWIALLLLGWVFKTRRERRLAQAQ